MKDRARRLIATIARVTPDIGIAEELAEGKGDGTEVYPVGGVPCYFPGIRSTGRAGDRIDVSRNGRTLEPGYTLRRAAGFAQSRMVGLHRFIFTEDGERVAQDSCGASVLRHDDFVMHPFSFAPSGDNAGAPQIGKMARNLGLALSKDLHEIANAHVYHWTC